jgi:hypothetical protein
MIENNFKNIVTTGLRRINVGMNWGGASDCGTYRHCLVSSNPSFSEYPQDKAAPISVYNSLLKISEAMA